MKYSGWIVLIILIIGLFALSCSDSGETTTTDGDTGSISDSFGNACSNNTQCPSGLCIEVSAGKQGYCSVVCSADTECKQLIANSCCDTENKYCMLGDNCGDNTTDGDNTQTLCTYEEMRCLGNDLQRCDQNGDWELYRNCQDEGKICQNDACVSSTVDGDTSSDCTYGETKCNDAKNKVERCTDSGWKIEEECGYTQVCDAGKCTTPLGEECDMETGCEGNNEYCLPDAVGSNTGNCVPNCDQDGVRCPRGWMCQHGICEPIDGYCTSHTDCEMDEFCNRLSGDDDGVCTRYCDLPGENCRELYECVKNSSADNYGQCVLIDPACIACTYDDQCTGAFYCEKISGQSSGCCKPSCTADTDCPSNLVCDTDGRCVFGAGGTDCGGCPPGYICDTTFGQCVLNCPACGPKECCDDESAPNCFTCECDNPAICGLLMPPCCFGYSCSAIVYGVLGYCI